MPRAESPRFAICGTIWGVAAVSLKAIWKGFEKLAVKSNISDEINKHDRSMCRQVWQVCVPEMRNREVKAVDWNSYLCCPILSPYWGSDDQNPEFKSTCIWSFPNMPKLNWKIGNTEKCSHLDFVGQNLGQSSRTIWKCINRILFTTWRVCTTTLQILKQSHIIINTHRALLK